MSKLNVQEYLDRNLLVAKAIGIRAGARSGIDRLNDMKRQPKWMVALLTGIADRSAPLPRHLAKYRDQLRESKFAGGFSASAKRPKKRYEK